jgi:hypothetical protein
MYAPYAEIAILVIQVGTKGVKSVHDITYIKMNISYVSMFHT